jgi:probable rRNA maturation factor
MQLLIVNESTHSVPRQFLESWMKGLAKELKKRKVIDSTVVLKEVTLVFLDLKPAQKVNKQFRGKNYATDVLSFDSMDQLSLGELIVCPEVLKRQAKDHKLTYQKELGYMVLHGVLHLLGYDHELGPKEAKEMFDLQDSVFEILLRRIS